MLQISQGNGFSPSWDDPLEMLYACHGKVKRFTHEVQILGAYLSEQGCNQLVQQSAMGIIRYFTVAAPLHHLDEEEDFFPMLLRYAPETEQRIIQLNQQHDELEQCWQQLYPFLKSVSEGEAKWNTDLAEAFALAYAQHIEIEEPLFEYGRDCIPVEQLKMIGKNMAQRRHTA